MCLHALCVTWTPIPHVALAGELLCYPAMEEAAPAVLFVDEDPEAMNQILLRIEPVLNAFSLRTAGSLGRYLATLRPDVLVLSDGVEYRQHDVRRIIARIRKDFTGKILVLVDACDERIEALWRERGADGCLVHPTRFRRRLDDLSRKILSLAAKPSQSQDHLDGSQEGIP